jgi:hypothetical protein
MWREAAHGPESILMRNLSAQVGLLGDSVDRDVGCNQDSNSIARAVYEVKLFLTASWGMGL